MLPLLVAPRSIAQRFCQNSVTNPITVHFARTSAIRAFASNYNSTTEPSPKLKPDAATSPPLNREAPLDDRSLSSSSACPAILDEKTLVSRLSPLKRILCLCPVPLGRKRIPWTGGDPRCTGSNDNHAITMDSQSFHRESVKVTKYRYGEQFAIGLAVSDPYLTHSLPITLAGEVGGFVAELMPTFRCDSHNLGTSPIFHTNLPYFRHDLLQLIGHFDIGAVVIALPMKPSTYPFCPIPMSLQLEQKNRLEDVRKGILGVLQNYVAGEDDDEEDEEEEIEYDVHRTGNQNNQRFQLDSERNEDISASNNNTHSNNKQQRKKQSLGPLSLQGYVHHRLSVADVLAKASECDSGKWDSIANALKRTRMIGQFDIHGSINSPNEYVLGKQDVGFYNTYSSVPPEIHASIALTAMMEEAGCRYNSFF